MESLVFVDVKTVFVAIVAFLAAYQFLRRSRTKRRHLPPGPWCLPFFGNLFTVASPRPLHALRDLAAKYGDVFTIRLGSQLVLVLNSYDAVREALVRNADDFIGRPIIPVKTGTLDDGIVFGNGEKWKLKRRVMLKYLRSFGMGKSSMERRIKQECGHLLEEFGKRGGSPFDPAQTVANAVSNVICSVIIGHRFEYSDSKFQGCIASLSCLFNVMRLYLGLSFMFSGAGRLLDFVFGGASRRHSRVVYSVFEPFIEEHEATRDAENARDFIDVFLGATADWESEECSAERERRPKALPFKYFYVYRLILDMFAAGTESTATTLSWAWLYMLKHPGVQRRVQAEIDRVLGIHRFPEMSDRPSMPYTQATISEVLRLASTVPLSVPRRTVNDTKLYGYDIPKDTMVWPNIWSVHRSPERWSEPEKFDPTRFLDSAGKFSKPDLLIPFGIGPRVCIGEQLVKTELFLVFSSVLQHYSLEPDPECPLPDLEGRVGLTLQPKHYKMRAVKR